MILYGENEGNATRVCVISKVTGCLVPVQMFLRGALCLQCSHGFEGGLRKSAGRSAVASEALAVCGDTARTAGRAQNNLTPPAASET